MSRTLSWIDRIVPMARSVADSARSHYDRKELQHLFELQPRSAQQLMAALPTISVGRAKLVERDALVKFLAGLQEADDPAAAFAKLKQDGAKHVPRRLRGLSLQDYAASVDAPPATVDLVRGELHLRFTRLEELAEAMLWLATVLRDDLEAFADRYEPRSQTPGDKLTI